MLTFLCLPGAPKDLANGIGWTPLHEAAFYNHVDVVRSLLVYGADATLRDAQDALAYHVASLGSVRDVLEEMGGELCGHQIFNPTSMCAYATVSTRALRLGFEDSTRAIDPSKN